MVLPESVGHTDKQPYDRRWMTMPDLLLKNVVISEDKDLSRVNVTVSEGIVTSISPWCEAGGNDGIDCDGAWLLPGAIDLHVHFREPGATHKEDIRSGSGAALRAGITTVVDMPNNTPPIISAKAFLEKADLVQASGLCDVLLYMALTADNIEEIREVSHHPAFAGVKVFLGATTGSMLCGIDTVARAAAALDCLFVFHAEDEDVMRGAALRLGPGRSARDHLALRPVQAAVAAVRQIASVYQPGMRFHVCHVSTVAELQIIEAAGGITCEATPHHLSFSDTMTATAGDFARMNPPLRTEVDRAALFQALIDGRIDCLATDHAPHLPDEKCRPWPMAPSGVPGVETLVPWALRQVQEGFLSVTDAVRLLSKGPARILGLTDRGQVEVGLRADLMVWDPKSTWHVSNADIRSKCGWSLFDGMPLAGLPVHVCRGGELVY